MQYSQITSSTPYSGFGKVSLPAIRRQPANEDGFATEPTQSRSSLSGFNILGRIASAMFPSEPLEPAQQSSAPPQTSSPLRDIQMSDFASDSPINFDEMDVEDSALGPLSNPTPTAHLPPSLTHPQPAAATNSTPAAAANSTPAAAANAAPAAATNATPAATNSTPAAHLPRPLPSSVASSSQIRRENLTRMDVDERPRSLLPAAVVPNDIALLVLQEQQTITEQQKAIFEQQRTIVIGQKDIQRDVQNILSSPARKQKGHSSNSRRTSAGSSAGQDADDEGDDESGSDDKGSSKKDKLPSRFHVCFNLYA